MDKITRGQTQETEEEKGRQPEESSELLEK